jgi:uncharacterized membrane protein
VLENESVGISKVAAVLCLFIIVSFFLFNSGFIYELANDQSYSLPLSSYRMNYDNLHQYIVLTQEVVGIRWISGVKSSETVIYSDTLSQLHLIEPYGLIDTKNCNIYLNTTFPAQGSFIYLNSVNLNLKIIETSDYSWEPTDNQLNDYSSVYSNGDCSIYYVNR